MNIYKALLICVAFSMIGCVTTKVAPRIDLPVIPSNLLIPPVDMMLIIPVSSPITKVNKDDGTNNNNKR